MTTRAGGSSTRAQASRRSACAALNTDAKLAQDARAGFAAALCEKPAAVVADARIRVGGVPSVPRRVVAALLCAAVLGIPVAARAQSTTLLEEGADVSSTPPVPLAGGDLQTTAASELPNTGTDPRLLFFTGLALTLIGFGLRLRTADADDY
jgi:hypothetical protein